MKNSEIILSLYPNTRGFGYVSLQHPKKLLDFCVTAVCPVSNAKLLERVTKLIDFFNPTLIILRECTSRCAPRNVELIKEITLLADKRTITLHRYSRKQIRDVFEQFGATTKYEITQKIVEEFPELAPRVPQKRKPWNSEDHNMGVFDAMALVVTHKYLTE